MPEYHIGCGAFSVYAGTLNKSKTMWVNKTDISEEIEPVYAEFIANELQAVKKNKQIVENELRGGRTVTITVEVRKENNNAKV